MNSINVNFDNLTENERKQLLRLVEKSNKGVKLSEVKDGNTFKIGDIEFIKFFDENGVTIAVTKDIVFNSTFGEDNNLHTSVVLERLDKEFLPKIAAIVGIENICKIETDLTTLDGLKPYGTLHSRISLPTVDFYRANVEIFDKYKLDKWWWLATPYSAKPHYDPVFVSCVSPSGDFNYDDCNGNSGVRPFLRFLSSICVSCEE